MTQHALVLLISISTLAWVAGEETCSHISAAVQAGTPPCKHTVESQYQDGAAATPSGASQQRQLLSVAADNYTFVDDTATMGAGDVGATSMYTFVLPTLAFTSMFWTNNNTSVNETANMLFQQAVRRSFLAGVAVTTKLKVTTTSNPTVVRLGFANITRLVPGDWRGANVQPASAVVVTVSFYAPNSAASDDLASLSQAVNATPSAFFAASTFTSNYGPAAGVSGSVGDDLPGASGMSTPVLIALGVCGGALGALLVGSVLGYAVNWMDQLRRRSKLRPMAMYDEGQQGDDGVYEAWQEEGDMYEEYDPPGDEAAEYQYDERSSAEYEGREGRRSGKQRRHHRQRQQQLQHEAGSEQYRSSGGGFAEFLDEDRYRNPRTRA